MRINCRRAAFLAALGLTLAAPTAVATESPTRLAELLAQVEVDRGHSAPCLVMPPASPPPLERPSGHCAANLVVGLYLGLLRDRERLAILHEAISQQGEVLDMMLKRLEGGGGSEAETLMAEVELKRWQLREAAVARDIQHAELFFATAMESAPAAFVRPQPQPEAWPEDDAAALAALAQLQTPPRGEGPTVEAALKLAWIDYEAARRDRTLLEPMQAFAEDVARATRQWYEVAQFSLTGMLERMRDDIDLRERLVTAEYRLLAVQFHILDLLGRRTAFQ